MKFGTTCFLTVIAFIGGTPIAPKSGVALIQGFSSEPQSTAAAVNTPDQYAWRLFVALNWPAEVANRRVDPNRTFGENAITVWESWKLSSGRNDEVFLADGADPGPWLPGRRDEVRSIEDFERLPLQQAVRQASPHDEFDPLTSARGRNENHMNEAAYEFVRALELYNVEGQEQLFGEAVALRDNARQILDNQGRLLDASIWNPKLIDFPPASKEVKAQWREIEESDKPRYRWHEMEEDGESKLYGLTALHITTKDLPNWFWATFEHVDNPTREGAEPWIIPTRDAAAGPSGYPAGIGIEGTRWENYRLRGIQSDFVSPTGEPTILANSQIEAGFQQTSSCITCHARATIGRRAGTVANRLSIFENDVGTYLTGSVGVPDPGLFQRKTLADPVIGELLYLQGDFVWSLLRARRRIGSPAGLEAAHQDIGFAADIGPLFRPKDVNAMKASFDLSKYEDVKANADDIYDALKTGFMPCDAPWSKENVDLFKRWVDGGKKP